MSRHLSSADISIFLSEISNFYYIGKYRQKMHFDTYFPILLTLIEYLWAFLINMIAILVMLAKLATPGILK